MKKFFTIALLLLTGCTGLPENIKPVTEFELNRYLGKWYEIARLEHSFENGMDNITAEYSLNNDGSVKVLNRGYLTAEQKWKQAEGVAYFMQQPDVGYLKVSFFRPFYGSYIVLDLDKTAYQYALVTSYDKSYFWILARTPHLDPQLQAELIAKAKALGFATEKLIYPQQLKPLN
jgi:apolipoprotein D and lipocalin family protein